MTNSRIKSFLVLWRRGVPYYITAPHRASSRWRLLPRLVVQWAAWPIRPLSGRFLVQCPRPRTKTLMTPLSAPGRSNPLEPRGATTVFGLFYSGRLVGRGLGLAMLRFVLKTPLSCRVLMRVLSLMAALWFIPTRTVLLP